MEIALNLNAEFLLGLLGEYRMVTPDQKDYFLKKKDYYENLYINVFKKEPFITELLLFMADKERVEIDEEFLLKLIARRAGCDFIHIDPLKVDSQLVISTISQPYGRKNFVLPLYYKGDVIVLAMANPFRSDVIDQLSTTTGKKLFPVVASVKDIDKILLDVFGFKKSIKAAAKDAKKDVISNMEQLTTISSASEMDDKHVIKAVDYMLKYAIEQSASDIHLEPKKNETYIRFRIDGILHTIYTFPVAVHLSFVSRLKMLSRMDIAEKRRPQDGRIKVKMDDDREVELRSSTIPIVHGEKLVLRILESGNTIKTLEDIGFVEDQLEQWRSSMKKEFGMLLVTGPTGSGKSTTLYSNLKELANPNINIVSIEDPVEIVIDEINQMSINTRAGITFSTGLRHLLRQDPDILMIGEIRDSDTAENAVQSALTGHLVFSTLHTNDTAGSVQRLTDLGVEPFLIASVLNGILAQRLVRKLCSDCSFERDMTEQEKISINLPIDKEYKIKDSEGCVKCRYTGYKGRIAIVEFLQVTPQIKSMISKGATAEQIKDHAIVNGMITLRDAAIKKLADGVTSYSEILKALYYD